MNISRRYPWMLWPDSICPSFLPNPILPRVQGDHYWKIEVDFENTENNFSTVKDVFCFVPKCTSLSIFENKLFIGLGYDNQNDRVETNYIFEPNVKYNVTYEVFDGSSSNLEMTVKQQQNEPDATLTTDYTLTEDDFDLVGNGQFDNFDIRAGRAEETVESRRVKIETILLNNFTTTTIGDLYNVTYAVWEGFDSTRVMLVEFNGTGYDIFNTTSYELYTYALEDATTRFTLTNEWAAPVTFTADEYTLMGQRFPNFSDQDEAKYKIGIYLKTLYQFAAPEDFVAVEYNYFSGGVSQRNVNYVFDGSVWNAIPSVIDNVLKFGHNGTTWVPDNTIKYTLTNADFNSVGNGRYNNFDVRAGKDEETVEARRVKINTILLANFPSLVEGQKFTVSYAVFSGANEVYIMNLIHNGTEYILQ